MGYAVKVRSGMKYATGNRNVSTKARGNFNTKTAARKAIIREVRRKNLWAKKMPERRILSVFKIIKR